jgi:acyl-coenzyme A thioesterase PaaI-like protein
MKINYLEAVEGGIILADARVIRSGRYIAVVDCDIRDEERLVGVGPFNRRGSENAPKLRS